MRFSFVCDQWYPATDGAGYALVFRGDLNCDYKLWNVPAYWKAGVIPDGTPGMAEPDLRLMHYWSFNASLEPTYTVGQAELVFMPGPITELTTDSAPDFAGLNNRLDETTGTHLRINNPLGAVLTLRLPTAVMSR